MTVKKYASILKFLMSGGVAAATEYVVFLVLHEIGLPLFIANAFSFMCGLVVSFTLNKQWVFAKKGGGSRQFTMYFTLACINLLISSGLLSLLVHGFNMLPSIAKLGTMILIASWNYIIYQKVIFKKTNAVKEETLNK